MNEREIFVAALHQPDARSRKEFLDRTCGTDAKLRSDVEALLKEQEGLGSFLEAPAAPMNHAPGDGAATETTVDRPGSMIGPYKLLELIGEGGFGVVYLAEQQEPVRRKVALKILKPGMDTRQIVARFEAERQALAIMDHPNIARVFDGGTTGSEQGGNNVGRPYFVMELVKGVPITEFCDQNHLTPRQRLELFIPVCQAVQHAHQKGIIHRDLKPSNVLVTRHDTTPIVKVIDFGVAKALGQELTDKTLFTGIAQMIGTPLYMSPEQAGMSDLDVDTRSDIYSLGVLLYELLTGTTPFTKDRFQKAAYDEIRRIIREEDPPKPSTRLSDSMDSLPSISAQRQTEPARLTKLVRGELDWIVMKALEKDRNRRYETALSLASDVQRFLADEPVQAGPPSRAYRLRKFVRRHRGPVVTVGIIILALVGGIVGTTFGLFEARKQRDAAIEAKTAEEKAKIDAEVNRREAQAVVEFLEKQILAAARPEGQVGGLGPDVTLRRAVEAALPFVESSFTEQPLIEARLRMTLGLSFNYLGEAAKAADQYQKACTLFARHRGTDHVDTLRSKMGLANSYAGLDRHLLSLQLNEEVLPLLRTKLGDHHGDTLGTLHNRAANYYGLGRLRIAHGCFEETLPLLKSHLGANHSDTLLCMNSLAVCYLALGRGGEAFRLHDEAFKLRKTTLGPTHPETLRSMNNLALSHAALGRAAEAAKLHQEVLTQQEAKLGPDHPHTLRTMYDVANCYMRAGRFNDALNLHEKSLARRKATLGTSHLDTLRGMAGTANSYHSVGRFTDALRLREEALELMHAKFGPEHPDTLMCAANVAVSYSALGRHSDALKHQTDTLSRMQKHLGEDHPNTLGIMNNLAITYGALDRHTDAFNLRKEMLTVAKAKLGPDHPTTLSGISNLASSYIVSDRYPEAQQLYAQALASQIANLGQEHRNTLVTMRNLAWSLVTATQPQHRDPARAVQLAKKAVELSPQVGTFWNTLGVAHYRAGDWKESVAALEKSTELRTGGDNFDAFFLAMAHWQLGKADEARKAFDQGVQWMEKNRKHDRIIHRFRAEAEDLLGIGKN